MIESLNQLAEERRLEPWTSWIDGRPKGYFDNSQDKGIAPFFKENGFVVIEGALNSQEISDLRAEATKIARGELGDIRGIPFDASNLTDEEVLREILCIHFPHKISALTKEILGHQAFVNVLTRVIGPNVKCMQSMLFIKGSGKPGQAWHQDEIYIPTRDRSLTGGWIALDDATVENGCLWVIPGSQRSGTLYFQEWHADPRFDCSEEAKRFPYTNDEAVPVEVKAGSIVFFNGYLLHRSLPNYSEGGFRRALVNHYMSAESLLPWGDSGKVGTPVAQFDSRDIEIIAGIDPYAWRGYESKHGVHIRPDGKGGCGHNEYNKS
jgi:phytanoyl-CoA hydroxylase